MNEMETFRTDLARLRSEWAALKFMHALERLRRVVVDKAYNPNQPRVPAGNADGGQWSAESEFSLPRLRYDPGRREDRRNAQTAFLAPYLIERYDMGPITICRYQGWPESNKFAVEFPRGPCPLRYLPDYGPM